MDDEAQIYDLWRIRRTALQMCHDRGYLVSQEEIDQTFEQFKSIFGDKPSENKPARSHLNILAAQNDDPTITLAVQFSDKEKIGIKEIREFFRTMEEDNISSIIVVVQQGITPIARELIKTLCEEKKCLFQIFFENELLINITEHNLVPKHVILTQEEKQELLNRYRLKESQLPRIQTADPVARYFGLIRGQVVRISRTSETAGRYITYRLVT